MPIDYRNYPADWPAIRARILERAGTRCEWCGLENGAVGIRDRNGDFISLAEFTSREPGSFDVAPDARGFTIVLTIAHLDHDVRNNADDNLAALCQKCHLTYDAKHHAANARRTRDRKRGQLTMLEEPPAQ